MMFDRFSERARRVLFFARYELSLLGGTTIEPDHILLGLLRESKGVIAAVLSSRNISAAELRKEIEQRTKGGARTGTSVEVPFANSTKRVLNFAIEEADRLLQMHIEPEHLLLAMLREKDSLAAICLMARGMTLDATREYFFSHATTMSEAPQADVVQPTDSLAATHVERIMKLARELARAEPNSEEARELVERIDDELVMLSLRIR